MTSWVRALVRAMAQASCGIRIPSSNADIVHGSRSLGCPSTRDQSIVRPSSLGGVPVFSRPWASPISRTCSPSGNDARSPRRPPSLTFSPIKIFAARKVPVAMTSERHPRTPALVSRPTIRPPSIRSAIASAITSSTPL